MHSLTYVFITPQRGLARAVAQALTPFGEEATLPAKKRYLDCEEIEAMAERMGLDPEDLTGLAEHLPEWDGEEGGVDAGGLYALRTRNPHLMFDWHEIGGRWAGTLPGNVERAARLLARPDLARMLPHDFLTPDGVWHARDAVIAKHLGSPRDAAGEQRWFRAFRESLARWPDHLVVCVDCHA
jgi:hypothetical protein